MLFKIANIEFLGPFSNPGEIEAKQGIFLLLKQIGNEFEVIDFGYSKNLRTELNIPDEQESAAACSIVIAVHYSLEPSSLKTHLRAIESWFEQRDSTTLPSATPEETLLVSFK
ncbi:MAG: hypothetical protein C0473_01120 [Cyanobacteria bacterium DS3.002]|jgi:hypothetical protein|nr:hypothetical protein [Cyanobacteria bacterium DS3.002]